MIKISRRKSPLQMSVHNIGSVSAHDIWQVLRSWENTGWVPDVVVIDYADILAVPFGYREHPRDGHNQNWMDMRLISQEFHCLVLTATQADAASYNANLLDMSNFSNDKRKFAHVTGMVGLNQTPKEKEDQILRLNWLVRRESESSILDVVHLAECRAISNTCVKSCK